MLEVRHLEIVQAIARAGSVTAAAKRLHLTQPAVSHALGDLEARLGVSLFVREPRGMRITPEGDRLLDAARVVLEEVGRAEQDLQLYRSGRQGILRVSTECYTCYHWLPPILTRFSERFPDVAIQIAPEATRRPLEALGEERLEMAIVHSDVDDPELIAEDLFTDELVAAVPPGHPWAGSEIVTPEAFADQALLLHSDPETSIVVTEFLDPAGVRPARLLALQLTEAVLQSVKSGLGVTAMARWAVQPDVEAGELVTLRLGPEGVHRRWRLATRKDRAHRATIQELARLLKEESGVFAAEALAR